MLDTSLTIGRGLTICRSDSGWYRLENEADPPLTIPELSKAINRTCIWIIHTAPPPATGPAQSAEDHHATPQDVLIELYEHMEFLNK